MEKYVFDKITQVLNDLLASNSNIYEEQNKKLFNNEIRSRCSDDELPRDILLMLVVNDVFVFINNKDFVRAEKNVYNCLGEFDLYQSDYTKLFESIKMSEELKKIRRKEKLGKARNILIFLLIIAIGFVFIIINHKSYFRTDKDVLVGVGYTDHAFFISKTEEHDENGFPLVNMSWYEVINYCNELSKKNNLACVYKINEDGTITADLTKPGYRLPTEKEWYWAARGAKNENPTNYSGAEKTTLKNAAWYIENSSEKMQKVAQKEPNRLGIYDMSGNVAEWCFDSVDDNYRIVCGGFYGNSEQYLELSKSITKHKQNTGEMYIGFRVVRSFVKKNVGVEK